MKISYDITLSSREVKLISQFMKQEKFTMNCVDEFYREYGVKMGGEIIKQLKANQDLCKEEFDEELERRMVSHHIQGDLLHRVMI